MRELRELLGETRKKFKEVNGYHKYDLRAEQYYISVARKALKADNISSAEIEDICKNLQTALNSLNIKSVSYNVSSMAYNIDLLLKESSYLSIDQIVNPSLDILRSIKNVDVEKSVLVYVFSVIYKVIKVEFKFYGESELLSEVNKCQEYKELLSQFIKRDLGRLNSICSFEDSIANERETAVNRILFDALANGQKIDYTDDEVVSLVVEMLHSEATLDKNIARLDNYEVEILNIIDDMNANAYEMEDRLEELTEKRKYNIQLLRSIRTKVVALLISASVLVGVNVGYNSSHNKSYDNNVSKNEIMKNRNIFIIINTLVSVFGVISLLGLSKELMTRRVTKKDLDMIGEELENLRVSLENSKEEGNEKKRQLEELINDFRVIYMSLSYIYLEPNLSEGEEVIKEYDETVFLVDRTLVKDDLHRSKKLKKELHYEID